MKNTERDQILIETHTIIKRLEPIVTDHEKRIQRQEKFFAVAQAAWVGVIAWLTFKKGG